MNNILNVIKYPFEILLPCRCTICGRNLFHGVICDKCLPEKTITRNHCKICYSEIEYGDLCPLCPTKPYSEMRFLWNYNGAAKRMVSAMKYKPSLALTKIAGKMLYEEAFNFNFNYDYDCIVPIPSSKINLQIRGFNQSEILAYYLSKTLGLPVKPKLLIHTKRHLMPQASLSHDERLKNVRNIFKSTPNLAQNKNIIIVDDVVTTGATVKTASEVLLNAGAKKVAVVSLIRSETWNRYRNLH